MTELKEREKNKKPKKKMLSEPQTLKGPALSRSSMRDAFTVWCCLAEKNAA